MPRSVRTEPVVRWRFWPRGARAAASWRADGAKVRAVIMEAVVVSSETAARRAAEVMVLSKGLRTNRVGNQEGSRKILG